MLTWCKMVKLSFLGRFNHPPTLNRPSIHSCTLYKGTLYWRHITGKPRHMHGCYMQTCYPFAVLSFTQASWKMLPAPTPLAVCVQGAWRILGGGGGNTAPLCYLDFFIIHEIIVRRDLGKYPIHVMRIAWTWMYSCAEALRLAALGGLSALQAPLPTRPSPGAAAPGPGQQYPRNHRSEKSYDHNTGDVSLWHTHFPSLPYS